MRRLWLLSVLALGTAAALACGSFSGGDSPVGPDAEASSDLDGTVNVEAAADAAVVCTVAQPSGSPPDQNCLGNGTMVDLQTSTLHCGRCGHSCLGASCVAGLCMSVNLNPDGGISRLGDVDPTFAYYQSGPDVQRARLDGGGGEVVARTEPGTGDVASFVHDASRLYVMWHPLANTTDIGIVNPIGSGDAGIEFLVRTSGDGLVADSKKLYLVDYASVVEVDRTTRMISPVQNNMQQAFSIVGPVSRDEVLFWMVVQAQATDGGAFTQRLFARTMDGTTTMRAENLGAPMALAVDATHVYWADASTNQIMRIERTGTRPATAVAKWPSPNSYVKALLLDGDQLYWAVTPDGQAGADATIYQAPKCAASAAASVLIAHHPAGNFFSGLLTDGKYLYYGALDGIQRVAK